MPKPKVAAPRSHLVHAELFGRPGPAVWAEPTSVDDYAGLRAAEVQHHAAVELLARLEAEGQTLGWLERRSGIAMGRMSKIVRGHAHLSLRDLQAIEGVLGPILTAIRFDRVPIADRHLRERFDADTRAWGPAR